MMRIWLPGSGAIPLLYAPFTPAHRGADGTHKTPAIHKWLLRHPRFRKLRRSAHCSITELEADIRTWINDPAGT